MTLGVNILFKQFFSIIDLRADISKINSDVVSMKLPEFLSEMYSVEPSLESIK